MNNYYDDLKYQQQYIPNQANMINPNYKNNNSEILNYTESMLKSNIGKKISIYASFPDSIEWRDKIFNGTLENAGTDYVMITDEENTPIILQSIYINFIKFENKLN